MAKEPRSNVIDFKTRKAQATQSAGHSHGSLALNDSTEHVVLDLRDLRKIKENDDRRAVNRTVLSKFIGSFVVIPEKGLQEVDLHDISQSGVSFDLGEEAGTFGVGDVIAFRVYLSHETFFKFSAKIVNVRPRSTSGTVRHGAVFQKDDDAYQTLYYFVRFLENVAAIVKKDRGDRVIGRLD